MFYFIKGQNNEKVFNASDSDMLDYQAKFSCVSTFFLCLYHFDFQGFNRLKGLFYGY